MVYKSIIGAMCACLAVVSFNANAAIISVDWKTAGDNLITRDTDSGLEWLDLTVTQNRSYNDISSKFGIGQEFDGWSYATAEKVSSLWDAFDGDSAHYDDGLTRENNGLFERVSSLWGSAYCQGSVCPSGGDTITFMMQAIEKSYPVPHVLVPTGYMYDAADEWFAPDFDFILLHYSSASHDFSHEQYSSALVRVSPVPIPSAVWLFGSGLIGLIGLARRKANV